MVAIKVAATLTLAMAARSTLIWLTRPVGEAAWQHARRCATWKTLAWIALAAAISFEAGWAEAMASLAGAFLIVRLFKGVFEWQYGGLPGWGADMAFVITAAATGVFMTLLW